MTTVRHRLLLVLQRLHEELEELQRSAEVEGDHWTGVACAMVRQALSDAAQAAEAERVLRGG